MWAIFFPTNSQSGFPPESGRGGRQRLLSMTTSGCMFALEASSALSDFRAERLLADLKSVYPQVKAVSGR